MSKKTHLKIVFIFLFLHYKITGSTNEINLMCKYFQICCRKFQEKRKDVNYSTLLETSESFHNPNFVNNLLTHLGIPNELYTHFSYLK